jgi:hypothetical protein
MPWLVSRGIKMNGQELNTSKDWGEINPMKGRALMSGDVGSRFIIYQLSFFIFDCVELEPPP